ncbi:hypothetical protein [Streptomyces sp. TP-A0875]|uniref:DUF7426 family protein n=1 Tax=Streptomyces sp. TP-A0875 TaxID=552354 RepID=UPI0006B5AFD7|nr:hypothetical protein [Streptomyces sp. TP-A0875]
MAFNDVSELLDECLSLPIRGRIYTVPAPEAAMGLRTQQLIALAAAAADGQAVTLDDELMSDDEESDFYERLLGSAFDDMVADGVKWPLVKHAAVTSMIWIAQNKDAAERYWNSGGDPSRMAPNREARRRSGGASSTRSQGSTSGTSTRTAPRHRARKRR